MLYLNGMWQLDGWQLDPACAPALRGATDLLAEYLSGCVNGERITGNGSSLAVMGGQALAEALTVLGEYDAADAVLAAESSAATPAPDSDRGLSSLRLVFHTILIIKSQPVLLFSGP